MKYRQKNITKSQHFVPQFYLKKFVNHEGKLEILDCERRKIVISKYPKSVCRGEYFYSPNNELDEVSQIIEDNLSKIENDIAKKYKQITERIVDGKQITFEDRMIIATLMSLLFLRGVYMRKQVNKMEVDFIKQTMKWRFSSESINKELDKLEKKLTNKLSKKEREDLIEFAIKGEYDIVTNNASHLRFMTEMEGIRNLFWGKYWTIYISRSRKKFITSDNPVVEVFPDWHNKVFWGATFLNRTHYFSMTPEIMIIATDPHNLSPEDLYAKRARRKTLFDNKKDNEKILGLNFVHPKFAKAYAYSNNKENLQDIIDSVNLYDQQSRKSQELLIGKVIENKNDKI